MSIHCYYTMDLVANSTSKKCPANTHDREQVRSVFEAYVSIVDVLTPKEEFVRNGFSESLGRLLQSQFWVQFFEFFFVHVGNCKSFMEI